MYALSSISSSCGDLSVVDDAGFDDEECAAAEYLAMDCLRAASEERSEVYTADGQFVADGVSGRCTVLDTISHWMLEAGEGLVYVDVVVVCRRAGAGGSTMDGMRQAT